METHVQLVGLIVNRSGRGSEESDLDRGRRYCLGQRSAAGSSDASGYGARRGALSCLLCHDWGCRLLVGDIGDGHGGEREHDLRRRQPFQN